MEVALPGNNELSLYSNQGWISIRNAVSAALLPSTTIEEKRTIAKEFNDFMEALDAQREICLDKILDDLQTTLRSCGLEDEVGCKFREKLLSKYSRHSGTWNKRYVKCTEPRDALRHQALYEPFIDKVQYSSLKRFMERVGTCLSLKEEVLQSDVDLFREISSHLYLAEAASHMTADAIYRIQNSMARKYIAARHATGGLRQIISDDMDARLKYLTDLLCVDMLVVTPIRVGGLQTGDKIINDNIEAPFYTFKDGDTIFKFKFTEVITFKSSFKDGSLYWSYNLTPFSG